MWWLALWYQTLWKLYTYTYNEKWEILPRFWHICLLLFVDTFQINKHCLKNLPLWPHLWSLKHLSLFGWRNHDLEKHNLWGIFNTFKICLPGNLYVCEVIAVISDIFKLKIVSCFFFQWHVQSSSILAICAVKQMLREHHSRNNMAGKPPI